MDSHNSSSNNAANGSLIGFASYQQQNSTADHPASDLISIILFFSIIVALIASFAIYFWFTEWHKIPPQQRREERLEYQKEIDQLVENIRQQVQAVFKIPVVGLLIVLWKNVVHGHRGNQEELAYTSASADGMYARSASAGPPSRHNSTRDRSMTPATMSSLSGPTSNSSPSIPLSHEHQKVLAHKYHHLISIICLILFIVAFIILIGTASAVPSSSTSGFLQASLFVVVLCINMFLVTRQRFYYKERKELFGSDDAHMNAVYKTRFNDWDRKMWSNWVQIVILIIEFFQLLTFPLRDLMTVNSFGTSSTSEQNKFEYFVSLVLNAGGLMPDMRTPTWYTYTVWTTFVATCVGLLVAVVVHGVNTWRPYRLPNQWVHWCIPIVSLMYIPVLTTFVSSAACQSLNVPTASYASTLRCHADNINQQTYLWLSLTGYIAAYFLMTIFLTSHERIPHHNEIAFKSIGIAFIKNMGLLLAINFLLVESTTNQNRLRAILSITILLTMICYNIKTRPCYVDKINYFRTASFTCILWTSVLVAILSDTNAATSLGPVAVLCIILGGWAFIILLFIFVYIFYYSQPSDDNRLDSGIQEDKEAAYEWKQGSLQTEPMYHYNNAMLTPVVEEDEEYRFQSSVASTTPRQTPNTSLRSNRTTLSQQLGFIDWAKSFVWKPQ
ncbi:hypothetical protein NQZ79_g5318 [Umbelopsis isabellina]|nr:hypothetical protein NQZ79_g5318 [Umbelopsis isabellina]